MRLAIYTLDAAGRFLRRRAGSLIGAGNGTGAETVAGARTETGTEKIPRGYRYPAGTTTVRYDVSFVGLVSCTTR
jgi:hypothetical protein